MIRTPSPAGPGIYEKGALASPQQRRHLSADALDLGRVGPGGADHHRLGACVDVGLQLGGAVLGRPKAQTFSRRTAGRSRRGELLQSALGSLAVGVDVGVDQLG